MSTYAPQSQSTVGGETDGNQHQSAARSSCYGVVMFCLAIDIMVIIACVVLIAIFTQSVALPWQREQNWIYYNNADVIHVSTKIKK